MTTKCSRLMAFALGMLALVACTSGSAAQPTTSEAPLPVKIVLPPFLSDGSIYIAQAEGYFTDAGLEVEVVTLDRSVDALPALIQKTIDVSGGAINIATFSAIAQGSHVKFVANKGFLDAGCSYDSLFASADAAAAGGLDNPDLPAGNSMAVSQANYREYWVSRLYEQKGFTFDDFQWETLAPSAIGEALASGDLTFGVLAEPTLTQAVNANQGVEIAAANEVLPGFQYSFINFGPSILDDNPEIGRRFMVAYLRGVRQFNEGKTDRNVQIIADGTHLDPEVVRAACWPTFPEDVAISTDDILAFQDWGISRGYLDSALPVEKLVDSSFQQYAVEQLAP